MEFRNCVVCVLLAGIYFVPAYAAVSDFSVTRSDIIFDESESLNPSPVKADNGDLIACFGETGDAGAGFSLCRGFLSS